MIYHLTTDGPKLCRAIKRDCPLGTKHFEELSLAQESFESSLGAQYGLEGKPKEVAFDELFTRENFDRDRYLAETKQFFDQVSADELEALKGYTATRYGDVNSALYEGKARRKAIAQEVRALDAALEKAPAAPKELWRSLSGRTLPQEFNAKKHKVGEIIHFPGFTSTSETPDALMHIPTDTDYYMSEVPSSEWEHDPNFTYRVTPTTQYTEGAARNVLFKIKAKKAAPVSTLRSVLAEEEWLLPRDTKFRLVAVHRNVNIGDLEHIRFKRARAQVYELEEI